MRADRLLSILMLLQARGKVRAGDLARRLEVSERTIYRDIEALSAAGVPVYATRGPGGGCALLEPYRTTLTGMTEAESQTLFVSGALTPLDDLGLRQPVEMALLKLMAALPRAYQRGAEATRQRLHIDPTPWFRGSDPTPLLRPLYDALAKDCLIAMTYRRGDGTIRERTIAPLGLVCKAGIWYLVARVLEPDGGFSPPRNYRVGRIMAIVQTAIVFERPADFDLVQFWATAQEAFHQSLPRYPVTVRIAPNHVADLPPIFNEVSRAAVAQAPAPDVAGWVTVTITFESLPMALTQLLILGAAVEVLAPIELRQAIMHRAEEITRRYSS